MKDYVVYLEYPMKYYEDGFDKKLSKLVKKRISGCGTDFKMRDIDFSFKRLSDALSAVWCLNDHKKEFHLSSIILQEWDSTTGESVNLNWKKMKTEYVRCVRS